MRRKFIGQVMAVAMALGVGLASTAALAEEWPSRPISLVVPFGAGSSPDTMARKVAEYASKKLGQPIVVENKPGASGNLGTGYIARAKPDGYTFGTSITGPMVNNTLIYDDLPYDPKQDLIPLTLAVHQYNVIVVRDDSPFESFDDLLEALKDQDNDFNFPSTGAGTVSHLSIELILDETGGNAVHIPYSSSPEAVTSIIAGDTDFAALPPVTVVPMVRDGRLRALATVSAERLSFLPDTPTVNEFGMSGVEGSGWIGFVAPAGVPDEIRDQLSDVLREALQSPEIAENLTNQFMEPVGNSPEEFGQYMDDELERWGPLITRLEIKAN